MKKSISVKLPQHVGRLEVEAALSRNWRFEASRPARREVHCYDTFDWRLFQRGLMLSCAGGVYVLTAFAGDRRIECDAGTCELRFAWEFPAGELRSTLTPILRERALLVLAAATVEETSYAFLDDAHKTVARMTIGTVTAAAPSVSPAAATFVMVQPLRGYGKMARKVAAAVPAGEAVPDFGAALYAHLLQATGQSAGSYDGQFDLRLEPDMRADDATKAILRRLLEMLRANEAGICADIDTEFLHDYRVAIRRTRAALRQLRAVFPADVTPRFKEDFRALGNITGELRDLDVYLLAEADFRAMIPDTLGEDITPLFDRLRLRRAVALARVIEELGSARYAQLLADWQAFLASPGSDDGTAAHAARPIVKLAGARIYKRYRRIVKDGEYILEHGEEELLHTLRLECKRLRYLLEFFASLFPRRPVADLVGQLKKLQDNLGEFSDLAVQQDVLLAIAADLPVDDPQTRRALLATGALVEALSRRQKETTLRFVDIFAAFAAPATRKMVRSLFGPQSQARTRGG